uniref:Uncharacterized protein n=1 Tax=Ananas comosus var. bracteatus TaxID=296719 RepID=A0A6V7NPW1_ANACO|nr:unnamed protein product [Ananas comosus var. bracteatus]
MAEPEAKDKEAMESACSLLLLGPLRLPPPPLLPLPLHSHKKPSAFPRPPPHSVVSLPPLSSAPFRAAALIPRAAPPEAEDAAVSDDAGVSEAPGSKVPTGFGAGAAADSKKAKKGKGKGKGKEKERGSVIRRSPIQRPSLLYPSAEDAQSSKEEQQRPSVNESAFLLAWLGLGSLILVEGVVLAASGTLLLTAPPSIVILSLGYPAVRSVGQYKDL